MTPVKWKSHTIRKAKAGMELNGERIVVLIVQVPLKPEAISINVAGAESNQEELSTLLLGVLASLDGESNWVSENGESTTEEMKNAKKAITRDLYLCLLVPVAIVVAIYIRRQSRRDQAST